jgi:hypothetical protein
MNNQKLATAIAALFAMQTQDGENEWEDADEALNAAAIVLWEAADCHRWEFAAMLINEGVDVDAAVMMTDTPNYEMSLVQQMADGGPA